MLDSLAGRCYFLGLILQPPPFELLDLLDMGCLKGRGDNWFFVEFLY